MSKLVLGMPRLATIPVPTSRSQLPEEASKSKVSRISICTNRTCKRQGSVQVLRVLEDLELKDKGITVESCGCLGNCGSGPNIILDNSLMLRSVGTSTAVKVLEDMCSYKVSENMMQCIQLNLPCVHSICLCSSQLLVPGRNIASSTRQLKMQGNSLAQKGDLEAARDTYLQALDICPENIAYKLHSNLSLVALSSGDTAEALLQAQRALDLAPEDFTTAKIRMIEACLADGSISKAREHLQLAVQQDQSFSSTQIFEDLNQRVTVGDR